MCLPALGQDVRSRVGDHHLLDGRLDVKGLQRHQGGRESVRGLERRQQGRRGENPREDENLEQHGITVIPDLDGPVH